MRFVPRLVLATAALAGGLSFGRGGARTLTLAMRADVTGFYPNHPYQDESYTYYVNTAVFEGLVRFDRDHKLVPAVAESWESVNDTTWRFRIRKGIRFSDGTPVTAADAAASLLAPGRLGWANREDVSGIESAVAVSPDVLEVRTRGRGPGLLYHLPWGFILPERVLSRTPVPAVGTGPYVVESWKPGREIRFRRNPAYHGPPAPFDTLRLAVVPDARRRLEMLRRGEADLVDEVPLDEITALEADPAFRVHSGPSGRVIFLAYRMSEPPFSDARVREAVDLAIDREELIRRALGGRALPASQVVSPAVPGYDPTIPLPRPDRERARRLLGEAGYGSGFDVRLDGPNNRYVNDAEILSEVSRQLALVGIRVEVNARPKDDFYELLESSRFYLFGWAVEYVDSGEALDSLLHSRQTGAAPLGTNNFEGLADPLLDRLIEYADAERDPEKRRELQAAAMRRAAELRAVLPLEIQQETFVAGKRVRWEPPVNMALHLQDLAPAGR